MGDLNLDAREAELINDLKNFNMERDRVRRVIGKVGGKRNNRIGIALNIVLLLTIAFLFVLEITTHFLPTFISIEIGVLLVSIKIVWMIHSHAKFYHFQFWMLNSIEYRMNDLLNRVKGIEKKLAAKGGKD